MAKKKQQLTFKVFACDGDVTLIYSGLNNEVDEGMRKVAKDNGWKDVGAGFYFPLCERDLQFAPGNKAVEDTEFKTAVRAKMAELGYKEKG